MDNEQMTLNTIPGEESIPTIPSDGETNDSGTQDTQTDTAPAGNGNASEVTKTTEGQTDGAGEPEGGGDNIPDEAAKGNVPYDRFKEVNEQKNAFKQMSESEKLRAEILEKQNRELLERIGSEKKSEPEQKDYVDISTFKPEKIQDLLADDPVGFLSNLTKQIRAEVVQDVTQRTTAQTREQKVKEGYAKFAETNKEFESMFNSGELQRYCDRNPHHNPISAYLELHPPIDQKTVEQRIKEAEDRARKEAEEKSEANLKAKRNITTTGAQTVGRLHQSSEQDPRLQNTKTHGGREAVLAERLREMRQQGNGYG